MSDYLTADILFSVECDCGRALEVRQVVVSSSGKQLITTFPCDNCIAITTAKAAE